jgi:hypothetical protein
VLCQQCGAPIAGPRKGGQRKRFCNATCRGRWHRSHGAGQPTRRSEPEPDDERGRVLEALFRQLVEDVENEGTLIPSGQGGAMKGNPSAALLVRVIAELDRREVARAAAEQRKEVDDGDDIGAALRAVG